MKKNDLFQIRISPEDKAVLVEAARVSEMTVTEFVRSAGLREARRVMLLVRSAGLREARRVSNEGADDERAP